MNLFRTNDNCYEGYDKEAANSRECLTFSEYNGNEKMTLYFDGGSRPVYNIGKKTIKLKLLFGKGRLKTGKIITALR